MKVFTISAALLSLGAYVQAYTPGVYVTFEGAADASYSQVVPADGTTFTLGTSSDSFACPLQLFLCPPPHWCKAPSLTL